MIKKLPKDIMSATIGELLNGHTTKFLPMSTNNNIALTQLYWSILGIQKQGLNTELDDVETRLEEYPMTLAFLHLLDVLIDRYG